MEIDGALPGLLCRRPRPFAAAIASTNAVTVILTFTTASQSDELMEEQ